MSFDGEHLKTDVSVLDVRGHVVNCFLIRDDTFLLATKQRTIIFTSQPKIISITPNSNILGPNYSPYGYQLCCVPDFYANEFSFLRAFNDADTIRSELMSTNEYKGSHIGEYWIRKFALDGDALKLVPSMEVNESIRLSRESVISLLAVSQDQTLVMCKKYKFLLLKDFSVVRTYMQSCSPNITSSG